jgi:ketosteroid isomerase-like protein
VSDGPGEPIATTRRLYRLFEQRDIGGILGLLQPDVEWAEPANPYNPSGGARHGHAGFLEWVKIGQAAEEILALEPTLFLTGADSVAVVGTTTCRVRATGKAYTREFVHVLRFRDGKVASFREYFDTFAAAEAFRPG